MPKIRTKKPYKHQTINLAIVLSVLSGIIAATVIVNLVVFGSVFPAKQNDKLGVWTVDYFQQAD